MYVECIYLIFLFPYAWFIMVITFMIYQDLVMRHDFLSTGLKISWFIAKYLRVHEHNKKFKTSVIVKTSKWWGCLNYNC